MSMTDYEIAVNAGRTILCSLEADGRLRFLSQSQRDVAVMMQDFFANRALELRAAEKEPEEPPAPSEPVLGEPPYGLLARVVALETAAKHAGHRSGDLEYDVNRLFSYVSEHTHSTNHPNGLGPPCTVRTSGPWTHGHVVCYEKTEPVGSKPKDTKEARP